MTEPLSPEALLPPPSSAGDARFGLRVSGLSLLLLAIIIFPLTYILTSFRWHELLKALDIHIGLMRTFTLNMVGAFYNTFMPGSTGGDVLKAIYVSRQTPTARAP